MVMKLGTKLPQFAVIFPRRRSNGRKSAVAVRVKLVRLLCVEAE